MQNKSMRKIFMVAGAVAIIVLGLFFLISGDNTGWLIVGAGVVELVMLPIILKKMEDMNR
ncbi:hypothetical protein [Deinococcus roseus]|uniref:Uncharacterized protein n=1 Tax=Deinococcus roseus TaxID=392414 RepID=A0ABQ2D153_9DEIO|nr:hypothetical protein [Deinococcus roseus]GGJ34392.1 hypothetical protein GCM10008938_20710 [Deinococcus roseus]